MSEDTSNPVVECTSTEEETKERSEYVRSILSETYERVEERADGYTLVFDGTDETLLVVAAFVSNERRCCSFADYTIAVSPPYDETQLTVTGPDGTKELFSEGLLDQLESAVTENGSKHGYAPQRGCSPKRASASSQPIDSERISAAEQRKAVRERYAEIADQPTGCCNDTERGCAVDDDLSQLMGYSTDDLASVEPGANLGLGCGNPTAIAGIEDGDTVLDLGSGAGFDCFLAA